MICALKKEIIKKYKRWRRKKRVAFIERSKKKGCDDGLYDFIVQLYEYISGAHPDAETKVKKIRRRLVYQVNAQQWKRLFKETKR